MGPAPREAVFTEVVLDIDAMLRRGEEALIEAKEAGEGESLTLDFKANGVGQDAMFADGKLAKLGRSTLAKAISAFSNSAGGSIVIGVDCRTEKGIDRIRELVPLSHLAACQAALQGALGDLIQPRHDGIMLHAIASAKATDHGYLVVQIPRSERRPHMSQVDHHYYKRSGSASFPMEHYDIEDAFRRQEGPILSLSSVLTELQRVSDSLTIGINLFLKNEGRRSAQHAEVAIKSQNGFAAQIPGTFGPNSFTIRRVQGQHCISAPQGLVINPGATVQFHRFQFSMRCVGGTGLLVQNLDWNDARLEVEYELRAADTMPARGVLVVERGDLAPFRHQIPGYRGG